MGMMQSQEVCPTCHGTGQEVQPGDQCTKCHGAGHVSERHELKVKVPAGVDDGQQMRLQGQGDAGENGGPYGDLYIVFRVAPSKQFKRDGAEIYLDQPISFVQAALGDEIKVPTVHGDVELRIPAGTQTGTTFRLRGKGAPRLRGTGNGDEQVTVKIQTPKKLSKKQKEALRDFAVASGESVASESLFERIKNKINK